MKPTAFAMPSTRRAGYLPGGPGDPTFGTLTVYINDPGVVVNVGGAGGTPTAIIPSGRPLVMPSGDYAVTARLSPFHDLRQVVTVRAGANVDVYVPQFGMVPGGDTPPPTTTDPPATAYLEVDAAAGVTVTLNGQSYDLSTLATVPAGDVAIVASQPGHVTWRHTVTVAPHTSNNRVLVPALPLVSSDPRHPARPAPRAPAATPTTGTVAITVNNRVLGAAAVTVAMDGQVVPASAFANSPPTATFAGVPAGHHTVSVTRDGFVPYQGSFDLAAGGTYALVVPPLAPVPAGSDGSTGTVAITVNNRVLGAAAVTVAMDGQVVPASAFANSPPTATFAGVPAGHHTVSVTRDGSVPYQGSFDLAADGTYALVVPPLAPVPAGSDGSTGTVVIVSPNKAATYSLDGRVLDASLFAGSVTASTATVPGVTPGPHTLQVTRANAATLTLPVTVIAGGTVTVDVPPLQALSSGGGGGGDGSPPVHGTTGGSHDHLAWWGLGLAGAAAAAAGLYASRKEP